MKIMYVMTDLALGGAEIQVMRMIECLSKNNKVIFVSMMAAESEEMKNKLDNMGVTFYSMGLERGSMNIKAFLAFLKIVRKEKPDVIHSHMIHANLLLRAASPFLHKSLKINTIHGEEEFAGKRKMIYRLTDYLVDYTVCCGKALYNQAIKKKIISSKRIKYICNGLDTNAYVFSNETRYKIRHQYGFTDEFIWITVGRLNEVKNHKYLLSEFRSLARYKCALVIVGDGPLRQELEQYVHKWGIANVLFMGKRDDVGELLSMADAFVLSSIHEGLPLSLQEAGAIGLPLVSTNVGGCNEAILEGKNGYLCESNVKGSLAGCMKTVMEQSIIDRNKMGIKSREIIVKKFDLSNTIDKWLGLYEKC